MKVTLLLEELMMFVASLFLYAQLEMSWWLFIGIFFLPDLGMIGYVFNTKVGALTYNILHHKGLAILLYFCGHYLDAETLLVSGIIIFSHAAFDRIFGFGLKYKTSFNETHLGTLGRK